MTGSGREGDGGADLGLTPNPGGPDDPLGESVTNAELPPGRLFAPHDVRLVIGRFQDPKREVHLEVARRDGVPVHRRLSGGGAVVLAPGMLVIALRLPPSLSVTWSPLTRVASRLAMALQPLTSLPLQVQGHGDLAVALPGGVPRKCLGASLRQTAQASYYLGVLLIADASRLMERYLPFPSRSPDYRAQRRHGDFCIGLEQMGIDGARARHVLDPIAASAGTDARALATWVD